MNIILAGDVERNPGPTEGSTGTCVQCMYECCEYQYVYRCVHYTMPCIYSNTLSVALQFVRSICVF